MNDEHSTASGAGHDDVIAMTAHELRGPISSIIGFAQTLRDRRHLLSEEQVDSALDTMARQATRLDVLLSDLLVLAADREGLLHLRPDTVALGRALTEILADEGADLDEVAVECDAAIEVRVDRMRLHQMVGNYLANARVHGRPPRTVQVRAVGATVEIAVLDSGDGVSEAHQARLFERFQRAGSAGGRGSGLGLAVVRALAEASGGGASYRPGPPGGHAFVLVLPAAG